MSSAAAQHVKPQARWKIVSLSDVAEVVNGGTPKSKVARYWGGDVQWLTPKDMGQMEGREIAATPRTISKEGLANSSAQLVPANSVILSTRAPIGHLAINTAPMAFNQGCRGIVPGAYLDTIFLYYFLLANKQRLNDLGSGTTFKELSASRLKSVQLPLPPLEEQKRIAAVLDRAFAALDRARANTEANLADASSAFQRITGAVFERLISRSIAKPLGELTQKITKGSSPKWQGISYVNSPGVLFITSENVNEGTINLTNKKYVENAFNKKDNKSILAPGDVLTNIVGASIGRTAVFELTEVANINQAVCLIRCNRDRLNNYYLSYLLNSQYFKQKLHDGEVNMARANISLAFIRGLEVPLPSFEKQVQTVEKLNHLRGKIGHVEGRYQQDVRDLAALRQSLLQKAFAGQLA